MGPINQILFNSLNLARAQVHRERYLEIYPVHFLWGLIKNPETIAAKKLNKLLSVVESEIKKLPQVKNIPDIEQVKIHSSLSEWITYATSDAISAGKKECDETSMLKYLLKYCPFLQNNSEYQTINDSNENEVPHFLKNLNELSQKGKLDPVIGRDKEIRATMEILGRRSKNNPILLGLPGVGKTAIVEGLAHLIIHEKVPEVLKGKTIYSLDLGMLMAGTKFRGEFEERMQDLLAFMEKENGNAILFIDEIHQLVGAGRTDGAMDAANLLKPALARGDLHCIGATTPDEYRKYILSDSALERRFRAVPINEPSIEDSVEILTGLKEKLEIHHGIKISDAAIIASVELSKQYMADKQLPDKAIDLIDEASAAMKIALEAMPNDLMNLESELRGKKILLKAKKEDLNLEREILELEKTFLQKKSEWEKEVYNLKKSSELKNKVDKLKYDLEQATRLQQYEEASKIKFSLIPEVEKEFSELKSDQVLSPVDVAKVISRHTEIPLEKILKTKQDDILHLEKNLKEKIFGQDHAIVEICEVLKTSYAGLLGKNRPLGSFLLLGPTGVGKTETAKMLAKNLFGSSDRLIRFDLSEYAEKHAISKLIGSPPGYLGHDDGGGLTDAIRKNPYSVILFDEVEKAHPDFSDILLQILDAGRLRDNKSRLIDFRNTIIVLTSNIKNVDSFFKAEFLGRFDAICHYHALSESILDRLVQKELDELNLELRDKDVKVELDSSALHYIIQQGIDLTFGARPLSRRFKQLIVRPIAHKILSGELANGLIKVSYSLKDQLIFGSADSLVK